MTSLAGRDEVTAAAVDVGRVTDVVLASAGLVVGAPLLGAIAAAVRLDSGAPVLFRQERVGRGGRTFEILKFRSMRSAPPGGPLVSATGDARVTCVGAVLRSTKLDELPQLVNVVRGDMSLVGPRPEVPRYVALWPQQDRDVILSVRPGITDPASIAGLDEGDELAGQADPERYYVDVILPRKAALYVEYVRGRTWSSDVRILGRTVLAVAARRTPWRRRR
ncbi:sugar transferase [Agilicoccus flavus]|uniref:sugar transferase n=1 Tax=Agilicoccus flavus TaxID=2775968 RepID=UPI001CF70001|nr:sugar transferase [Agilicoccus flavus]